MSSAGLGTYTAGTDLVNKASTKQRARRGKPPVGPLLSMDEHPDLLQFPEDIRSSVDRMGSLAAQALGSGIRADCTAVHVVGYDSVQATVEIRRGDHRQRRGGLLSSAMGEGEQLEDAIRNAGYLALRRLLVGDVAICGTLLDRKNEVRAELVPVEPSRDLYRLKVCLGPARSQLQGMALDRPSTFEMEAVFAARAGRTRYVELRKIPAPFKRQFSHLIDFTKRKVRLHRLITALAGHCLVGLTVHVHHINGDGGDNRWSNLDPLPYRLHRRKHPDFYDTLGELKPMRDLQLQGGALWSTWWGSSTHEKGGHQSVYGDHSIGRAWREYLAGQRDTQPKPLVEDRSILLKISSRCDRQANLMKVLDCVWDHDKPLTASAIAGDISLTLTSVTRLIEALCRHGLLARVDGKPVLVVATHWPTPLEVASPSPKTRRRS